jgi:hypothetical protein
VLTAAYPGGCGTARRSHRHSSTSMLRSPSASTASAPPVGHCAVTHQFQFPACSASITVIPFRLHPSETPLHLLFPDLYDG